MSNKLSHNQDHDELVIRRATVGDEAALERLAQLEGRDIPAEPILLAEIAGRVQAALSIESGAVIADPFEPTARLVRTLQSHARPASPGRGHSWALNRGPARRAPWPA